MLDQLCNGSGQLSIDRSLTNQYAQQIIFEDGYHTIPYPIACLEYPGPTNILILIGNISKHGYDTPTVDSFYLARAITMKL